MERKPESDAPDYVLICVVVNFGVGSKAIKIAVNNGAYDGTIFLGMGTMKSRILEFLSLTDIRKEIVLAVAETKDAETIIARLDDEITFNKPYHGIAFTMPLSALMDERGDIHTDLSNGGAIMYQSIFAVVDMGNAEFVMEAATAAGARGGTVIKGRGSATSEHLKLFHMDVEPAKEVVMILAEKESAGRIAKAIRDRLDLGGTGRGIIFCHDVSTVYGIS